MQMKKIIGAAFAVFLCVALTACVNGVEEAPETTVVEIRTEIQEEETASEVPIRVCVVYAGKLGDQSYHDFCSLGAQRAVEDFGIELKSLDGDTEEEWKSNLLSACEDGYDLIIGASPDIADYIAEYSPNYPDMNFVVIDAEVELPNVQSISFAQNEGFFLAGAAAAMFTEMTDIDGVNEEAIIGWVGGMDIPVLNDFFMSYEQGAKYINPDIEILQAFAGGWSDPLKGKELALAQFEQGADIIMHVASGTGAGVLEAAKENGFYAIGADLNQDRDQPGAVLTSVVKRVDQACYLTIQAVVEHTFAGGTTQELTWKDGGVSLTDFSVMKEYLGDKFPQEIVDRCDKLAEELLSGEIDLFS